jgi:hypothetical protein
MNLRQELDRYLTIRRSLGYDLQTSERVLRAFIAFAESQGADHIGTDLSRPRRDHGAAGGAGPFDMNRSARSRDAVGRSLNRPQSIGTDRSALPRRRARHRCAYTL